MPASQRWEFGRPEGNVLYPAAFHVHGLRQSVRLTDEIASVVADPQREVAAIPHQDGMLMVGG
jgi:hypothetical protein